MVETNEEVDEGQKVTLLGSDLLLCLENAQSLPCEQLVLHLKHGCQHHDQSRAAELGVE